MQLLEVISLNWPAALLLIAGLAFVTVELFTPGFGFPGAIGLGLLLVGVVVASNSLLEAILLVIIIILVLAVIFSIAVRSASKGALARSPLVLSTSTARQEGFTSGEDMAYFLGREGTVVTVLRPAGTADFDGVRLDVVADSEFVSVGETVKVVRVEGRRIVVMKTKTS